MNGKPLVSQLAQLTGAFMVADNSSQNELQDLKNNIASALLQQQPAEQVQQNFQFEKIENFNVQHLKEKDFAELNEVLKNAESNSANQGNIRAFRREVPFINSQVKGSVPPWARGAKIGKTIGPLSDLQGRKFWWDFYYTVPGIQLFLQGSSTPSLILSVEVSWFQSLFNNDKNYKIPECSVWINAHLLSSSAPDNEYCGLKVKAGSIQFTENVEVNNKQMIVPPECDSNGYVGIETTN